MSNTASSTTQHTPPPYEVAGHFIRTARGARAAGTLDGRFVAELDHRDPQHQANAAFIVRACNSHEPLVALVRRAQEILGAYLPPDGSSGQEAITALLELLDGPESRAALAAAGA